MKKIILINSYCDDNTKLQILSSYINTLKENNFDIFLYSPIDLPSYIINRCDFFFKTVYNPLSNNEMIFWKELDNIKLNRNWNNFSWSSVYQYKILSEICESFDYDMYYYTIYDIKLADDVIDFIKSNNKSYFFQFKRQDKYSESFDLRNCAMQFFCLNRDEVKKFKSLISETDLSNFDCAESYLYDISKRLNIEVHDKLIIEDIICTWFDFFNFSIWSEFFLFFNSQKILFYNIQLPINIEVKTDDKTEILNIDDKYFELPYNLENIEILIKYNNKELNIMDKIKKIKCSYEIR